MDLRLSVYKGWGPRAAEFSAILSQGGHGTEPRLQNEADRTRHLQPPTPKRRQCSISRLALRPFFSEVLAFCNFSPSRCYQPESHASFQPARSGHRGKSNLRHGPLTGFNSYGLRPYGNPGGRIPLERDRGIIPEPKRVRCGV